MPIHPSAVSTAAAAAADAAGPAARPPTVVVPSPRRGGSRRRPRGGGFTLIEVLIAMVIIGILTAFAYPSYVEHVRRGHRVEARTVLLDAAQFMQRAYSANDRYDQQRNGTAVTLPDALRTVPNQGAARYTIVIAEATATTYRLEARPTGMMASDACGTFTLNSLGQRNVANATRPREDCWR